MMSKRAKSFSLFAASVGAIAIGSAACSGGGGGGSSSPTPTAAATPNICVIGFETDIDATHANIYLVEMPASMWANGTVNYGFGPNSDPSDDSVYGLIRYHGDFSGTTPMYEISAIATAGSFTLGGITGAPTVGGTFTFSATTPTIYDHIAGTSVESVEAGSGGIGSITGGVLLDPADLANATVYDGKIDVGIHYMGVNSSLTIGATPSTANAYAYGYCDSI